MIDELKTGEMKAVPPCIGSARQDEHLEKPEVCLLSTLYTCRNTSTERCVVLKKDARLNHSRINNMEKKNPAF